MTDSVRRLRMVREVLLEAGLTPRECRAKRRWINTFVLGLYRDALRFGASTDDALAALYVTGIYHAMESNKGTENAER